MADASTMGAVLAYLRNWFERNPATGARRVARGTLSVEGGELRGVPDGLLADGQWLRLRGSRLNDGLHAWPAADLADEDGFEGEAWACSVPKAVAELADEVAAWVDAHGDAQDSPYQSESFGGYSYTKAGVNGSQNGSQAGTWQAVFAARLAPWRKL